MRHLTIRVAWHDTGWDARICAAPSRNPYCVALQRVREERNDRREDALAGRALAELTDDRDHPPCVEENTPFMNAAPWTRTLRHPYATSPDTSRTHGHLAASRVLVQPYTTFAVPYWWMLRSNQQAIEERMADPLARDIDPPFDSKWVFSATRQQELLAHVFDQVRPQSSLALFYTKSGHPLDERHRRLLIGVGTITALDTQQQYHQSRPGPEQPMWDRRIGHSIRPDGVEGVLLPYQDYLRPTGSPVEDARRAALVEDIAVGIGEAHTRAFSYGSELTGADVALSLLSATLEAVRLIRAHGIAGGPWQAR